MASFVLIHGAWHGGWCWYKLQERLVRAGHRVLAPDLPGHGEDPTPASEVTLDAYAQCVADAIDELYAQDDKVIVVGHSMGGVVISHSAERCSEKISRLVYVSGIIPRPGDTLLNTEASEDLLKSVLLTPDGASLVVQPDAAREVFYADCDEDDLAFALDHLCPQPAGPGTVPLDLTADQFGSIPRYYIECLRDRALLPATQRKFYTAQPCEAVFSLDSSHSPFFSMPDQLTDTLIKISEYP